MPAERRARPRPCSLARTGAAGFLCVNGLVRHARRIDVAITECASAASAPELHPTPSLRSSRYHRCVTRTIPRPEGRPLRNPSRRGYAICHTKRQFGRADLLRSAQVQHFRLFSLCGAFTPLLIPATLITSSHLFCSATMSLPNSAELILTTSPPCSSSRFWNSGGGDHLVRLAVEARDDVRRGFRRREDAPPDPRLVAGHGLRDRRHVGRLGLRFGPPVAISLSAAALHVRHHRDQRGEVSWVWPAMTSAVAGPPPLNGTCTIFAPVLSVKSSVFMCGKPPMPEDA